MANTFYVQDGEEVDMMAGMKSEAVRISHISPFNWIVGHKNQV